MVAEREGNDRVRSTSGTPTLSAFAHRKQMGQQGPTVSEQDLEDEDMVYVYQDSDDDGGDVRSTDETGVGIYGAYSLLNPQLQAKQASNGYTNRQRPSTFRSCENNPSIISESAMSYYLADGETLAIVGQFSIKVTKGTVEYLGAKLVPGVKYPIAFSSRSQSISTIKAFKASNYLEKMDPDVRETYPVVIELGSYFSGIEQLANYAPFYKDTFEIDSKDGYSDQELEQDKSLSFKPVYRPSSLGGIKHLSSDIWDNSINDILSDCKSLKDGEPHPVILVCGPKSVGKSTFCTHVLNSLVTKGKENQTQDFSHAGYLELDPGQPYFSPPGVMSLSMICAPILGPSFTQIAIADDITPVTQLWAHEFGYTSAKPDPDFYMQIFRDLYYRWHSEHGSHFPLIINTAGWMKGLGQELILQIINEIRPSHVVSLGNNIYPESTISDNTKGSSNISPLSAAALNVYAKMVLVDSVSLSNEQENYGAPLRTGLYSASQLRTLQMLSYLHISQSDGNRWNFKTHMTAQRPWLIPFDGIDGLSIIGLDIAKETIDKQDIDTAFNGTIVGITHSCFNDDEGNQVDNVCKIKIYDWSTSRIETSKLIGLGLIKAIDYDKREIHMYIPWLKDPERQFSIGIDENDRPKLVIVRGRIATPLNDVWNANEENNNNLSSSPWLEFEGLQGKKDGTTGPLGANGVSIRRNIMRRSQRR